MHTIFATVDLEQQIGHLGVQTVVYSSLILVVCTLLAMFFKNRLEGKTKLPLFLIMATTLIVSTVILFGSTIYLNTKSTSKGPVHWHADIEFWACGAELELRDPVGRLSNKIGSPTYHEHNDKRIHLEGVVVNTEDASLGKFMRVVGGSISDSQLIFPLNKDQGTWLATSEHSDGDRQQPDRFPLASQDVIYNQDEDGPLLRLSNGQTCGQDSARLQVFVLKYDEANKTYTQQKLANNPGDFTIRDEPTVPPGDCVIVEFDVPKTRTDKLCQQYGVRDATRCTSFGVSQPTPELCFARENVTTQGPSSLPTGIDGKPVQPSGGSY